MENFNQNMSPINGMNGMEPVKKSYGALIAVIVILVLIVIGGLYFLGQRVNNSAYINNASSTQESDSVTASLQTQSSSDDLQSIQKDLDSTDTSNLDQGAAAVEASLNSSQ